MSDSSENPYTPPAEVPPPGPAPPRDKSGYYTAPVPSRRMPGGIPYIVGNEAAERFSFYGMKTILAVFMTGHLLTSTGAPDFMSEPEAREWVHNFVSAVYFFPIVGAIVADWLFGKYRTIMILSLVYCAGHAVLATIDVHGGLFEPRQILWMGLALIAVGAGGIKPCVSAHVGDQFGPTNQHLLPRVFAWFYFSINLGSTISTLLTPVLLEYAGPHWAFGVPGILMALATLVFWIGRHVFVHIPPAGSRFFSETFSRDGIRAMLNLLPLYLFVAMFWALFDQTASAWVLQATRMDRIIIDTDFVGFGQLYWEVLPSQLQAINPILVMAFIPVFTYFVYPWMGRHFRVTPLRKVGIGLFMTVPSFVITAWVESRIQAGETPHVVWQLLAYVFITMAEIMVSITVLEFSYTQAPKRMKSFIMGFYMLSVALGNKFTAEVNSQIEQQRQQGVRLLEGANYYWFFTAAMLITAIVFVVFAQFYRGSTYIQGDDPSPPAG